MSVPPPQTGEAHGRGGRAARGRWRLAGLILLAVLPIAVALGAAGLWWRLTVSPLSLPAGLQDRIEARIDGAMAANHVEIGDMALALPEGGRAPAFEFRDVVMTDLSGAERAAFPVLRVRMAPGPLLRGQVRPRQIFVIGPGMRLSRDETGRFDVDFIGGAMDDPIPVSEAPLTDTMARLDAMFSTPTFSELQAITATDVTLEMEDTRSGPVLRMRNATATLTRDAEGVALSVSGDLSGRRDATVDMEFARRTGARETSIAMRFASLGARDLAALDPSLAWLDLMRAPISGAMTARLDDDGTLSDFGGTLAIGAGELTLGPEAPPLRFDAIDATLSYNAQRRRMEFGTLALTASQLNFVAAGHADVSEDGTSFVGQLRLSEITAAPEGFYDAPLALDGAAVDLRLTLAPDIRLEVGRAVLHDGPLRVTASGEVVSLPDGLAISVDAHVPETDLATVLSYWPATVLSQPRAWVSDRVHAGRLEGVDFALRHAPGAEPRHMVQFDFSDAEWNSFRVGPPITDGAGYLQLDGRRLVIRLDEGRIMAEGRQDSVSLAGSEFVIPDTTLRPATAEMDLSLAGDLVEVMHVLDAPPLNVLRSGPMTPERIGRGQLSARTQIVTRLQRRPEGSDPLEGVDLTVTGAVATYRADTLVTGRRLAADRLDVAISDRQLVVSGRASFDGVPITGSWQREIGRGAAPGSRLDARAEVSRGGLASLGVVLPEWLIAGRGSAAVDLRLMPDAPPALTLQSDLAGISLAIPSLGWQLGRDGTGRLVVEARLGDNAEITRLDLDAAGLTLNGAVRLSTAGGFGRLVADRFSIASWLDVQGALVARSGGPPLIDITGGIVDMRNLAAVAGGGAGQGAGGAGANDQASGPISVALDRLQVADGIALTDLRADLTSVGGLQGQFRGAINGAAQVSGVLVSSAEGTSVRLQSADGGAVMRAAGIYDDAYGGDMDLILRATGEPGHYNGRLSIDGPRLRNAPAVAELLNLISVVGLLEQLGGEGISLGDVNARFRLSPERIRLREGTALGPSLGLSMDGEYDIATRQFEMQGVISPFYMVNGLFGAIFAPRREGLFGFSYQLTGARGATNVTVNPLSILTPGIFREIFRAPPPDFSDEDQGQ